MSVSDAEKGKTSVLHPNKSTQLSKRLKEVPEYTETSSSTDYVS